MPAALLSGIPIESLGYYKKLVRLFYNTEVVVFCALLFLPYNVFGPETVKETEMLAKRCSYTLQSDDHYHVNIVVNPEGVMDVNIIENKQHVISEFDHVHFKESRQGVKLICEDDDCAGHEEICLILSRKDALELREMIDNAIQEYEQLMTDL